MNGRTIARAGTALAAALVLASTMSLSAGTGGTPFVHAEPVDGIADPGFESGSLNYDTECAYPESVGKWIERCLVSTGDAELVSAPVHSGQWAVHIDTLTSGSQHFIWQGLTNSSTCYTWMFYVRPETGTNVAELVTDWPPSGAPRATVFRFSDAGVEFQPWSTSVPWEPEIIDEPLPAGEYTAMKVVADGDASTQKVWIGGDYIGTFTGDTPFEPDTAILGDTPSLVYQADYYYDDVTLRAEECGVVGGIAEMPKGDETLLETQYSSRGTTGIVAGVTAAILAATFALGGAAWYARRRRAR